MKSSKQEIKIILWNIAGIKNAKYADNFLELADIIILQETWVTKEAQHKAVKSLNNKYHWWCKAAVKQKNTRGRASGGQFLGIRNSMSKNWSIKEWKLGLLATSDKYKIITMYNNVGLNVACRDLDEQLFEAMKSGKATYVIGDINARVGEETGYIDSEWEEHVGEIRRSQDKTINTGGRKLLKICEEWGLYIANGRVNGDSTGEVTFVGGNDEVCASVLDLVICLGPDALNKVSSLQIQARPESDHLPVTMTLKEDLLNSQDQDQTKERSELSKEKLKWCADKQEEYTELIKEEWEWLDLEENPVDWPQLKALLMNAARNCGMLKERRLRLEAQILGTMKHAEQLKNKHG